MKIFDKSLERYWQLANEATQNGDWPKAIKRWQKIINKFEKSAPADAWLWLTKAYMNQKQLDKAEVTVTDGLTKHPNKSKLLVLAGKIATANQDWQQAKQRWENVIEILGEKSPAEAWVNLAKAQRMLNQLDEAESSANIGVTKHGQNPELLFELAEIATTNKNWPAALKRWEAALASINQQAEPNVLAKQHARLNISILRRLVNIGRYKQDIKKYSSSNSKRKIAIVTSFTKGYDVLKPHEILDDRFDYVVYTDDKMDGLGIFDVRPLPNPELDGPRAIRYVKTHPHVLLKEYDIVVWLDTSLMIVGDLYPLVEKFQKSNKAIGSGVHPLRTNIYDEFEANIKLKKEDPKAMKKQIDHYKKEGFDHNDLSENTMLMFNNKHPKVAPALETWWEQIIKFSRRDQLSFNYSLWKNDTQWFRLTSPPHDIRNHPCFVMTQHHTNHEILGELIKTIKK